MTARSPRIGPKSAVRADELAHAGVLVSGAEDPSSRSSLDARHRRRAEQRAQAVWRGRQARALPGHEDRRRVAWLTETVRSVATATGRSHHESTPLWAATNTTVIVATTPTASRQSSPMMKSYQNRPNVARCFMP